MEAHRRMNLPAFHHDTLHAHHDHGGQHLLALARDLPSRQGNELFRVTGIDRFLGPQSEHRAQRFLIRH